MEMTERMEALQEALFQLMSEPQLAKDLGVTREQLVDALEGENWQAVTADLIKDLPTDMLALVEFVQGFLERLQVALPAPRWIDTVYTVASHRLFPENFDDDVTRQVDLSVDLTLEVVSLFIAYERDVLGYIDMLDFELLTPEEIEGSPHKVEYQRLLDSWNALYIQEILRIGRAAMYFDLLGHIAGVYKIALIMGRQMVDKGVPVDLCLLCGAAMVHDVGKFGSRDEAEVRRMAYLHYYYTDQWCHRHGLPEIGHIAMNHSTWDLELENLSAESLTLIYADFRVKALTGVKTEKEIMHIYSLEESFDVILNKLDNVDDKKRQRYQRVYSKLMDFQVYLQSLGMVVSLDPEEIGVAEPDYMGIIDAADSPRIFKNLAMEHNISIMHMLGDKDYLTAMLERLRANNSSVDIRAHLNVFQEYITYMSKGQKRLIFSYLSEGLIHPEGDIRRQAAKLMGTIIPDYDEPYRKELPNEVILDRPESTGLSLWREVLQSVFDPDIREGARYLRWRGYALQHVLRALMASCAPEERVTYLEPLLVFYRHRDYTDLITFVMLDVVSEIPLVLLSEEELDWMLDFTLAAFQRDNIEVNTASLLFLEDLFACVPPTDAAKARTVRVLQEDTREDYSLNYLRYQLAEQTGIAALGPKAEWRRPVSVLFLENLKTSTSWITKIVNIRRLTEALGEESDLNRLHIALHFSNLLKVSEQIAVRHDAGQALMKLAPHMNPEEINEVAVELTRGLEMDSFEFTKYIPEYLARLITFLAPKEFDENVSILTHLVDSVNDSTAQLALDTLAHIIAHLQDATAYIDAGSKKFENRLSGILGTFMKGLASYRLPVNVEAYSILGKTLFGNKTLSLEYKAVIFDHIYKRLLMLVIEEQESTPLLFYGHSTTLNHVYRFLSDYEFFIGFMPLGENQKVAFFPGTFDPFTLGHRAIVRAIRDQSFDVYLGVDEFSWSKNIRPPMIRRKIMQMSLAEEENVFLFPPDFPVNLGNDADLEQLRALFPKKEVYIVVGSDVIFNASAYTAPPTEESVHRFNHILIDRDEQAMEKDNLRDQTADVIQGKVQHVSLPEHLEQISSTIIRENITYHRDISHLIDRMAQNYIYENNLYLGEPKFKPAYSPQPTRVELMDTGADEFQREKEAFLALEGARPLAFHTGGFKGEGRLVVEQADGVLRASVLVQIVQSGDLYPVFGQLAIANRLRDLGAGCMAVFSDMQIRETREISMAGQRVLTEAFLWSLEQMATYCVYRGKNEEERQRIGALLERQGFEPFLIASATEWFYIVNMRTPMLLAQNAETRIKEPYRSLPEVQEVLYDTHLKLQRSLKDHLPGHLLLSYHTLSLQDQIVALVTKDNDVPSAPMAPRRTGLAMCVPVGNVLREMVVPNTVTRPLYLQRVYGSDMEHYEIDTMPFYDDLESQIRTIRSFNRPVIIAEELFNRGHTLESLKEMMQQHGLEVRSVDVGILTGQGRDLLTAMECPYRYAHYIPKIKQWFVETKGYPFIDGYFRKGRSRIMRGGLQKSVNPVLPYAASMLFREMDMHRTYDFSRVSLENALALLQTLERVYQKMNQRSLTLNRLPEVILNPVSPDLGAQVFYDYSLNASSYVEKGLHNLTYLENLVYVDHPNEGN